MSAKERKSELLTYLKHAILTLKLAPASDLDEVELCARFALPRR